MSRSVCLSVFNVCCLFFSTVLISNVVGAYRSRLYHIFYKWCTVFNDVEKPIKPPQEAENETGEINQKEAKEEEEYEPLTGNSYSVSANAANQLSSITSSYRQLNASNRHYHNTGQHPLNNWHRGRHEDWWSGKEQENGRDVTVRHDKRQGSRTCLPTDDDRRYGTTWVAR